MTAARAFATPVLTDAPVANSQEPVSDAETTAEILQALADALAAGSSEELAAGIRGLMALATHR